MPTIGLSDLTKIASETFTFYTKRKEHTRAQILEFLEAIASEARILADVWVKIYADLSQYRTVDLSKVVSPESKVRCSRAGTTHSIHPAFYFL
jgi:hypothetical protein